MTLQEYNDIFKLPCVKKMKIRVDGGQYWLTNDKIVSEKMSLSKSLCSDSNLRYGRCEAACFKIRVATDDPDYTGKWLYVDQELDTDERGYLLTENGDYLLTEEGEKIRLEDADSAEVSIRIGQFKVFSDKPTNDRMWRDLTCYDAMYDILNKDISAWYNAQTFPMTLGNFRSRLFHYGLNQAERGVNLINDDLVLQKGFIVDGKLSAKTVIEAICELNGVFGIIDNWGFFDYVSLKDAEELTLDYYQDGTGSYEKYETRAITGIKAYGADDDIGTVVGTTDNAYIIQNNPLIFGLEGTDELEDALENLLDQIKDDVYRPFNVTTYGNPMLPLGTKVTINTRNQTIVSYVINKEMTGIQGLKDTISATGEESQSAAINSIANDIEHTKSRIVLKVDSNGKIVQVALSANADKGTEFKVEADNIAFIANGTLELTANDLSISSTNFSVDSDGNLTCVNATVKGDIITDTLKINDLAYMSIEEVSMSEIAYDWTFAPIYAPTEDESALMVNALTLTSTYGFKLDGQAQITGGLRVGGNTYLGSFTSTTDINGNCLIRRKCRINNELGVGGNIFVMSNDGKTVIYPEGIELYYTTPHIDFRLGNSVEDYTARIIQSITDTLDIMGNSAQATWGTLRAAAFSVQSSKYVKENIIDISDAEAKKLLDLRPVSFDYKIDKNHSNQRGLIAEEVLEVMPEMVILPKDYAGYDENHPEIVPSIDYSKFVPYLIKMIQIQQKEIDDLKK